MVRTLLQGNPAKVMDLIRTEGPISQAAISKMLSLQPSTILRIVNDLMEDNLLVQSGLQNAGAKGGRRAALLELNPEGGYAIGVDLGPETITAVLMNLVGKVMREVKMAVPQDGEPAVIMETLKKAIRHILLSEDIPFARILGIGVSMPGKVDSVSGVSVYALHFKNWKQIPVVAELEQAFGLPVHLEHDIRAMAFGDLWFGETCQNMICMGYREGVGLGLVLNGALYQGSNQFAGDVGHVVVDINGPICNCGRRGCLEALTSERTILAKYRERIKNANESEAATLKTVYDAMKNGDAAVITMIREVAEHMGKVLSDLVRVYDPERIIIGGNCIATSTEFLAFIQESFQKNQPNYADPNLVVARAKFGDNCIAIGSASIILSRLFKESAVSHMSVKESG